MKYLIGKHSKNRNIRRGINSFMNFPYFLMKMFQTNFWSDLNPKWLVPVIQLDPDPQHESYINYCYIMLKSHNKYAGISKIAGRDETKHRTGTTKMPRFTVLNFTGEIKVKNIYDSKIKRTQFRNDQSKR